MNGFAGFCKTVCRSRAVPGCVLFAAISVSAGSEERVTLEVLVTGIEQVEGEIFLAVFDNEADFDARENAVASTALAVDDSSVRWSVELAVLTEYAVIAYQDLNGNREIDLRRFGPPEEPYGFSNNADKMFGPPSFGDAKFTLQPDTARLEIGLR